MLYTPFAPMNTNFTDDRETPFNLNFKVNDKKVTVVVSNAAFRLFQKNFKILEALMTYCDPSAAYEEECDTIVTVDGVDQFRNNISGPDDNYAMYGFPDVIRRLVAACEIMVVEMTDVDREAKINGFLDSLTGPQFSQLLTSIWHNEVDVLKPYAGRYLKKKVENAKPEEIAAYMGKPVMTKEEREAALAKYKPIVDLMVEKEKEKLKAKAEQSVPA